MNVPPARKDCDSLYLNLEYNDPRLSGERVRRPSNTRVGNVKSPAHVSPLGTSVRYCRLIQACSTAEPEERGGAPSLPMLIVEQSPVLPPPCRSPRAVPVPHDGVGKHIQCQRVMLAWQPFGGSPALQQSWLCPHIEKGTHEVGFNVPGLTSHQHD